MLELELIQGASAITVILMSIYGYWKLKHINEMVNPALDDVKKYVEVWLNSETGQKALYMVGGLIAQGAKGGFGLNKQGGKRGIEGMFTDLIGQFIGSKLGGLNPAQSQPQASNDTSMT
jgi:hypothetical protein